jgi:hypothetical protein
MGNRVRRTDQTADPVRAGPALGPQADKDGRYGFLATPESLHAQNIQITINPAAPDYRFPSHASVTVDTFVYNNLYYGDLVTVAPDTLVNFDIPMDPVNEGKTPIMATSPSIALGAAVAALADAGFWIGLIMVPLNFILVPGPFTFGTLCLFLGAASLRIWGVAQRPFGTTRDAHTGRPMPFALITLNDPTGRRVAFAVSDEQGRWVMTAEKGTYELVAVTSATVQPPRQSRDIIKVKKGWITREIKL